MFVSVNLIINIVLIVVCVVMALVFLSIPMQSRDGLRNYRISLRFFSLAYVVLSILTLVGVLSNESKVDVFLDFTAISLQMILFAFSLIVLLNPLFSNTRYVLKHIAPTFFFVFLSVVAKAVLKLFATYRPDFISQYSQPQILLNVLFVVFCIGQLIYFFRLFHLELKRYKSKIDDYYADTHLLKLHWVRYCFYGASAFCVLIMISVLVPDPLLNLIVTIVNSLFYIVFGLYYIQYPSIYTVLEPAINTPVSNQEQATSSRGLSWEKLKSVVVSEKYYIRSEINIEDMAKYLKVGRTTLSGYINKEENMSFHTWINILRIEEAKQLIRNNHDLSVMQIAERIGYSESSHFSRQFKHITGESPSVWRQRQFQNEQS